MRIGAHASRSRRREIGKFLAEAAAFVEQLVRPIASHPLVELMQVSGRLEFRDRHLMRAPGAFNRKPVNKLWPGPALRGLEYEHRPTRTWRRKCIGRARRGLDSPDGRENRVERFGKPLVHQHRIVAGDKVGLIAIAVKQIGQFLAADARQ